MLGSEGQTQQRISFPGRAHLVKFLCRENVMENTRCQHFPAQKINRFPVNESVVEFLLAVTTLANGNAMLWLMHHQKRRLVKIAAFAKNPALNQGLKAATTHAKDGVIQVNVLFVPNSSE